MNEHLILKNRLKEVRKEKKLSKTELAEMVGVSRNTISSIETGQFNPTAKLALVLCIALDKKLIIKTMKFYLSLKLDQFAATCLTSRYLLYCFRQNEKRGNIGEVNET